MLPDWLNEWFSLRRFQDGAWRDLSIDRAWYDENGARWTADAGDFEAEVKLDWERRAASGEKVAALELTVIPKRPDCSFSGILLHMQNDSSLRCAWKPHLAPLKEMAIGDKLFRSPAIVFENDRTMAALVPDLDSVQGRVVPHVMDYSLPDRTLMYGLCDYEETGHVYHRLTPTSRVLPEPIGFRFYLVEWEKEEGRRPKDFRKVERFLWNRFGERAMRAEEAGAGDGGEIGVSGFLAGLEPYADYAYEWALDRWKDVTWQQFVTFEGDEVGGVVFLVRAAQKPGFGREVEWREPKSLWNQAWFCGMRTAYGYGRRGLETGRADWVRKAELALNFALSAPQIDGLFPGYYQAGKSGRWEEGGWVMSGPRRPAGHEEYVHLLDSSWTCLWLLKWHRDIRADERIVPYVSKYANRLLTLQREDGSFPAWVRMQGGSVSPYLLESPETSAHVMLLCSLSRVLEERGEPEARLVAAAREAARFVTERIVPEGRWEDFETYWSCSRQWDGKQYAEPDARSGLYNQCNFGMYWTAEALKDLYSLTGEREWLDYGEQVLAEASLYQQIWQPSYIPVPTIGGFGVMTSDDEWNDARQSLFALTYWDYYRLTGNESYRARAIWAMKSSFYMMYCPENPAVKEMYERVHPHFDERDYGFHMENFNHHDGTPVDGLGEFTIFDWGCGAAAASLAEFKQRVSVIGATVAGEAK
ncbi:hypothetical protein [Cohnella sp. GCM10027633]|uniref:hypothetical protein n=1 Tax=unclassified Cohnella TaxID=2636738 RepID=UPI00362F4291